MDCFEIAWDEYRLSIHYLHCTAPERSILVDRMDKEYTSKTVHAVDRFNT
jgi:hypothetical protein